MSHFFIFKKNGDELLRKLKAYRNPIFNKGLISLQTAQDCGRQIKLSEEGTLIALHQLYVLKKIYIKTISDKINSNSKCDTIIKLPGNLINVIY